MGRRCEEIGCNYLAIDGTCLLCIPEKQDECPALERVGHEDKNEWIH